MNLQVYIKELRKRGKRSFGVQDLMEHYQVTYNYAKVALHRLLKSGDIISPARGFYVIIPPECQPYGSIPAEELVPILMQHNNAEYYVGLLSAGLFYGATHQKPARFQVISNKLIKHPLQFGQVAIELIYKKSLTNLPFKDFTVSTGYLKVGTPELTAIDLLKYHDRAGGISHIATVLSELIESIEPDRLIALAEAINEVHQLQRIGYILEKIDVLDEIKQKAVLDKLGDYLSHNQRPYVVLMPNMPKAGHPQCKKWKIIENTDFESDL